MNRSITLLIVVFSMVFFLAGDITAQQTPKVTSTSPATPIFVQSGVAQTFTADFDQVLDVKWFFDGKVVQTNDGVKQATYKKTLPVGDWVVSVVGTNKNGQASHSWDLHISESQRCAVDVFGTRVADNVVHSKLKNDGNTNQEIFFTVKVNSQTIHSGNVILQPEKASDITKGYEFPSGTHTVTVDAEANCGEKDLERIEYIQFQTYTCSSPQGMESQNLCAYESQKYLVCSGGQWNTVAQNQGEYCSSCALTCGDNVCNCGETFSSCPSDCSAAQGYTSKLQCSGDTVQRLYQFRDGNTKWVNQETCRYGCDNGMCNPRYPSGYVEEFRCSGNTLLQEFWDDRGEKRYVPVQWCEFGCGNGVCKDQPFINRFSGECSIEIEKFDFVSDTVEGQRTTAYAILENTGETSSDITYKLLLDGVLKDSGKTFLGSGKTTAATVTYRSDPGTHSLTFIANAACGDSAIADGSIAVKAKPKTISFRNPTPSGSDSGQTIVSISPLSLDIEIFKAKPVVVQIDSATEQDFKIEVDGVPADWVRYDPVVSRPQGESNAFIFVTPQKGGSHELDVEVTALKEGKRFTETIEIFSIVGDQSESTRPQDIFARNVGTIVVIVIVVIVIFSVAAISLSVANKHRVKKYGDFYYEKAWKKLEKKYNKPRKQFLKRLRDKFKKR